MPIIDEESRLSYSVRAGDIVEHEGASYSVTTDEHGGWINGILIGEEEDEHPLHLLVQSHEVTLARVAGDEGRVAALVRTVKMQWPSWQEAAAALRASGVEPPEPVQRSLFA